MMDSRIPMMRETCLRLVTKARFVLLWVVATATPLLAQVETTPFFAAAADSIVIEYDATAGNGALRGVQGDVYAHTGVITALSTSPTDWKYVRAGWTENTAACKMQRVDQDRYRLAIGQPHEFYGVPPNEQIRQLAFVFRTADGSVVGRAEDGSDLFARVYMPGYYVRTLEPLPQDRLVDSGTVVTIRAAASSNIVLLQIVADQQEIARTTSDRIEATYMLRASSKIEIVGFNSLGGAIRDTFTIRVRKQPEIRPVPQGLADGITVTSDSTATLVLYAPGIREVYAVGPFTQWRRDDRYYAYQSDDGDRWWIEIPLDPRGQTLFQWSVDDDDRMSDPYSEQLCDPQDASIPAGRFPDLPPYPTGRTTGLVTVINTTIPEYKWETQRFVRPDPRTMVVYELLVRDFTSESSFQGVIDSLDYLKRLGVQAIQLMPVQEFEANDSWGYNPSHLFAVDKYYGTKNDLKRLIDAAHARGIAVILDIVLNHQFGQSPLVQLWGSTSGPTPENPYFNVVARHPFNVGYDMNHESSATRSYSKRFLQHWMREYRIDGYRFDLSKGLTQTNTGSDVGAWGRYDSSRVRILRDYIDAIRDVDSTFYIIFEHFADNNEEVALARLGAMMWGNAHGAGSNAMKASSNQDVAGAMSAQRRGMDRHGVVGYVESHDEERMLVAGVTVFDTTTTIRRLEALMMTMLCIPGPKMLWQFNEVAYPYSINLNGRLGRKPLAWFLLNDQRRENLRLAVADLTASRALFDAFATMKATTLSTSDQLKTIVLEGSDCDVVLLSNLGGASRIVSAIPFTRKGLWHEFSADSAWAIYQDGATSITLQPGAYRLWSTRRFRGQAVVSVGTESSRLEPTGALVWPNPSHGVVTIHVPEHTQSVRIVDPLGGIVNSWTITDPTAHELPISAHDWAPARYVVVITTTTAVQTTSFIHLR